MKLWACWAQLGLTHLGCCQRTSARKTLQFQHGYVPVKTWQPMSSSCPTSSQPNCVRALGRRKPARNRRGKILYTELLKSWSTLGQCLANSPSHGKLQGSSLQWSSGNTRSPEPQRTPWQNQHYEAMSLRLQCVILQ